MLPNSSKLAPRVLHRPLRHTHPNCALRMPSCRDRMLLLAFASASALVTVRSFNVLTSPNVAGLRAGAVHHPQASSAIDLSLDVLRLTVRGRQSSAHGSNVCSMRSTARCERARPLESLSMCCRPGRRMQQRPAPCVERQSVQRELFVTKLTHGCLIGRYSYTSLYLVLPASLANPGPAEHASFTLTHAR